MKGIELINIGDEILRGEVEDENSRFISRTLLRWGLSLQRISFLPDDEEKIVDEIREATERSRVIIVCGGLGPTPDDHTRRAISKALNIPLEISVEAGEEIKRRMLRFNASPEIVEEQCKLPVGARAIFSKRGSAPGFLLQKEESLIFALPGVPSEMREILLKSRPQLLKHIKPSQQTFLLETHVCGLCEAEIIKKLQPEVDLNKLAFYPRAEEVRVVIKGKNEREVKEISEKIKEILGSSVYEKSLSEEVGKLLVEKNLTLSVAESCTGGWVEEAITQVPGSSRYFLGGVVAYSNKAKVDLLKVPKEVIEAYGAVSAECAVQMAQRVRELFGSSLSLSVTGIAGPTGGTREKPVGLTFICVSSSKKTMVKRYIFPGERSEVRKRAVRRGLNLLRLFLLEENF
jgi:nicotinamide-nucleotide amidase